MIFPLFFPFITPRNNVGSFLICVLGDSFTLRAGLFSAFFPAMRILEWLLLFLFLLRAPRECLADILLQFFLTRRRTESRGQTNALDCLRLPGSEWTWTTAVVEDLGISCWFLFQSIHCWTVFQTRRWRLWCWEPAALGRLVRERKGRDLIWIWLFFKC